MTAVKVETGYPALESVVRGVNILADTVKITYGPRGRNVLLDMSSRSPLVTKQGIEVARNLFVKNRLENSGASAIREVALQTRRMAGDGSTTAVILAQALVREGFKYISVGENPVALCADMDRAVTAALAGLRLFSRPCVTTAEISRIATVSANGDEDIGRLVAEAVAAVGRSGVITVEQGHELHGQVTVMPGTHLDSGYLSPHFVTDDQRQACVLEQPYILVTDQAIEMVSQLIPLLEAVHGTGRPLLVVAKEASEGVLALLVANHLRGSMKSCVVRAPGIGDDRLAVLEDIAALTGATVVSTETGAVLPTADLTLLGSASRVEVSLNNTVIIGARGDAARQQSRMDEIRALGRAVRSDRERADLQKRLSRFAGGVAVIRMGAATDFELKEKMPRTQGAIDAVTAALEEGTVPGGGVAFLRARMAVQSLVEPGARPAPGIAAVLAALEAPLRQMATNAGHEADVVVSTVAAGTGNFGLDAMSGEYGNLMDLGVIDPAKVARVALATAASMAEMLLMTDCVVARAV